MWDAPSSVGGHVGLTHCLCPQVPAGFLEVTQVAVREFSQAIAGGRDADPAWKKPIYRVISKLEADIPEAFRAPPGPPHT